MVLEIKDLKIQYKTDLETVYAVNGISLEMEKGETVGLVGETGAGKTTTALGVMGLLPERTARITEGSILFEGQELTRLSDREYEKIRGNKISMIFQDPMTALNPVLTVGSQIEEALELHNTDNLSKAEMEHRVEETLQMVGIPKERKNDYPYQFSGGMRQRVVIAMALVCNPDLLIADEPTTALDVTIQAQILNLLMDLQEERNLTYMFITHDLSVVKHISDEIMVMYLGKCVEKASAQELFANPLHPYTKALLAAIPIPSVESCHKRRELLQGEVTSPVNPKPGCRFAARCPKACGKCREESMELHEVSKGHWAACPYV